MCTKHICAKVIVANAVFCLGGATRLQAGDKFLCTCNIKCPYLGMHGGGAPKYSRLLHKNLHILHVGPLTEMSAWDIGGVCVGLTTLPPSRADCLQILGAATSCRAWGLSRAVKGHRYILPNHGTTYLNLPLSNL